MNTGLDIKVITGTGEGKTELSAFDAALKSIGVYNYNLITLSSIIPSCSKVEQITQYVTPDDDFGYRLYVIRSDIRSTNPGEYIAAGLGWYQFGDNRGLFVEHEVTGSTHEEVEGKLKDLLVSSLEDLCVFRGVEYSKDSFKTAISICKVNEYPACALVLAIYQSEPWRL